MAEALQEGLFEESTDGPRLIGGRCAACERHGFPFDEACVYCGAMEVERVHLSATGTLWGWTAVTNAPPGYEGPVPFGFGVVELPERIRVITRITDSDPDRLGFGQQMTMVIDEVGMYSFAPVDGLT